MTLVRRARGLARGVLYASGNKQIFATKIEIFLTYRETSPMLLSAWRFFRRPAGHTWRRRAPTRQPFRLQLEYLEPRCNPTNPLLGQVIHAIDYSPTFEHFVPGGVFFDSDFANDAFVKLWGELGGVGRNDLKTMHDEGFNMVRLYNWSPTRAPVDGPADSGHYNFLRYAADLGLSVMVPVSDYFISNDKYAWSSGPNSDGYFDPIKNGQVSYDFDAAPEAIQQDLKDFVQSITDPGTGKIFTNVLLSVGNELNLNVAAPNGSINGLPPTASAASKLARTNWWMVNLERMITQINGQGVVPITSPVSTSDEGIGPISWFQAFVNGVNLGDTTPNGTQNPTVADPNQLGGPFTFDVPAGKTVSGPIPGVATTQSGVPTFKDWYFNSYNPYESPETLVKLLTEYDQGGSNNPYQWPGANFAGIPLLFTEMGKTRPNADPQVPEADKGAAVDLTAQGQKAQFADVVAQVKAMETYLKEHKGNTLFVGFTYFEFTDEPGTVKTGRETNFGAEMLAETQPNFSVGPLKDRQPTPGTYPPTTILIPDTMTEPEVFAGGALPATPYRVEKLVPVTSEGNPNGTELLKELHRLFKEA
jgi:hypothetical protein